MRPSHPACKLSPSVAAGREQHGPVTCAFHRRSILWQRQCVEVGEGQTVAVSCVVCLSTWRVSPSFFLRLCVFASLRFACCCPPQLPDVMHCHPAHNQPQHVGHAKCKGCSAVSFHWYHKCKHEWAAALCRWFARVLALLIEVPTATHLLAHQEHDTGSLRNKNSIRNNVTPRREGLPDVRICPDSDLHFANVCGSQQQHHHSTNADAATHGEGKATISHGSMEGQGGFVFHVPVLQLGGQSGGIYTDTHAGQLMTPLREWMQDNNIAVEMPCVNGSHTTTETHRSENCNTS